MKNELIEKDGKYYKKCSVVMLPTEKESSVYRYNGGTLKYSPIDNIKKNKSKTSDFYETYYLYFLSDEEIEGATWCYNFGLNKIEKAPYKINPKNEFTSEARFMRKIVASTDESLEINDGTFNSIKWEQNKKSLPRPSNEFLQAYCKANGKIKEVLVEVEEEIDLEIPHDAQYGNTLYYKLKVSPDNTITIKTITQLSPEENLEMDNALQDKFDEGYVHRMNDEKDMHTKEEMFLNMQYYMEHCQLKGYVTPQDWLKDHKHF